MSEKQQKHPLTRLREKRGQTLEAFAGEIGASKGMVWKWENGAAIPRPSYMKRILEISNGAVTPNDWYEIPNVVPLTGTAVTEKRPQKLSEERS